MKGKAEHEKHAPSQDQAIGEFGDVSFKDLNHESRDGGWDGQGGGGANPKCDRAFDSPGSQDSALAEWGGISGGGKLSSLDKREAGENPLEVQSDSEYNFNADSPFRKG